MKVKNVGLMALALALGSVAQAEETSVQPAQKSEVASVKELVDGLESSFDQNEYDAKLEKIKVILDRMSKEEVMESNGSVVTCRSI